MNDEVRAAARLTWPRVRSLVNAVQRGERKGLYLGFLLGGVLTWLAIFAAMIFLADQLWSVEGLGPFLGRKLIEMLLASLFVLLTFSNVITALSTYFLAEDLELVLALPVSRRSFHFARWLDAGVQASWMMGLFGVPVFLSVGIVAGAPPSYYLVAVAAIAAVLVISTNLGVFAATLLVNVFPARRTRELMVLIGVIMVASLFVLFRTLRPEQLVDAEAFQTLAEYLAALQVPAPLLFPPRWASSVIGASLFDMPLPAVDVGLLVTGMLASTAVARWATALGFDGGWARAQEARAARFYRSPWFDRLAAIFPRRWRPLVAKEMRLFVRDPSQWSQVFLLAGLCAVYLVSIQSLPVAQLRLARLQSVRESISFLNLGMAGFVMSAIAARFQFTAVSREGRAWWILRGAPLQPMTILWGKGTVGLVPTLLVGQIVVVGSGVLLEARPSVLVLESVAALALAVALSGLALAAGAAWPDFRAETTAKAASSPAAVFYMVMAQVLVGIVLVLFVIAAYFLLWSRGLQLVALVPLSLVVAVCAAAAFLPLRRAADSLWARGI